MKHRGYIYNEFPGLSPTWWRVDCTCGWTDPDLTEHRYAVEAFDAHLAELIWEAIQYANDFFRYAKQSGQVVCPISAVGYPHKATDCPCCGAAL